MPFAEHRVKRSQCPQCRTFMDAATNLQDTVPPSPGDLSICVYYGALLQFQPDETLGLLPPETLADLALRDPRYYSWLLRAQSAIVELMAKHAGTKENARA